MKKITPYSRQLIDKKDIEAVNKVLKSNFLTQGEFVPLFEKNLERYSTSKFAVTFNSATSALHISCLALGLRKGDILWTSPISFVASSNAALYCGANVDFVDIDYETSNISIDALRYKLEKAKKNNCLPKIVMPVHMCGYSCEMKSIYELSKKYNFKIIEDASHAIGGKFYDSKVGSCKYSDITVYSFHPVKIITSAEGGAALTNKKYLFKKLEMLRTHGIVRNVIKNSNKLETHYDQIDLGYNYRMSDLHAALGNSQLSKINKFVKARNELAKIYDKELINLPIILPKKNKNIYNSYHLYLIKIKKNKNNLRNKIFKKLREEGFGVNIHYIPIYSHPYYKKIGFKSREFPQSELHYKNSISIPLFPGINLKSIYNVIKIIKKEI